MGLFNKYSISILLVTIGSLANAEVFNYDYVNLKAGTTSCGRKPSRGTQHSSGSLGFWESGFRY